MSWFGVELTISLPPSTQSHAQPLPNLVAPAFANSSWKSEKLPKAEFMARAKSPEGSPPPPGPMIVQNMLWFKCPPPLFLTAVLISSGTLARSLIISSNAFSSSSGCFSSAAFRLLMYVWWCFVWWISIVLASIWGSSAL